MVLHLQKLQLPSALFVSQNDAATRGGIGGFKMFKKTLVFGLNSGVNNRFQ